MKKTIIFLAIATFLNAQVITGMGYGKDTKKIKDEALSDLSSKISSQVSSDFVTICAVAGDDVKKTLKSVVQVKSELPILGAEFKYDNYKGVVKVSLDSERVLKLYEEKLKQLSLELQKLSTLLKKTDSSSELYEIYTHLQRYLVEFNKHKIVAVMLGSRKIPKVTLSEALIIQKLLKLSQKVDSLDLAAKLLAKKFSKKDVFIYPAKNNISAEITPFARVFKESLSQYVQTVSSPKQASYFLSATYEIMEKQLFITYTLINKYNKILSQNSITLDKKAYEGLRVKPHTITFDKEIYNGHLKNSALKVDIAFKEQGSKDVLLYKGDSVELVIRTNKPIYFYLVGHILHDKEQKSYLVELQPDGYGKEKYVYRLGGSDVNIPVSLGEFEIAKPFGFESVQMFASNKPLTKSIPNCKLDIDELCVIDGSPAKVMAYTRALLRPKKRKKTVLKAEAILEYTTVNSSK